MFLNKPLLYASLSLLLGGCSTDLPTLQERKDTAHNLTVDKKLLQTDIETSAFTLFTMQKLSKRCKNKDMRIYLEGDGLAWVTKKRISKDPTPINPLGLTLMGVDKSSCKVYMARPCQYIKQDICEKKYWTSHRYSPKVLQSFNEALDTLKSDHQNSSFTLIGYSGGGAIAALLSAKREDISTFITVAGNLDTDRWVSYHGLSTLDGSLNPAAFAGTLKMIPQYHLTGSNDTVIPEEIFISYRNTLAETENMYHIRYNATHTQHWPKHYKHFLRNFRQI